MISIGLVVQAVVLLLALSGAQAGLPQPFDPVSVRNPTDFGYPAVKRTGDPGPQKPLYCFEDGRKVFPSNHWWVPAVRPLGPSNVNYVTQLPYVYNIKAIGMEVSYPWVMAMPNVVQNIVNRHWTITGGGNGYCVSKADELTVNFKWGSTMEATLVRGSPYATARFTGAAPVITTQQGIRKFWLNDVETECNGTDLTGHKFSVLLRDSDETWVVYAPPRTTLTCQSSPATFTLLAGKKFTGVLRLAMANNCSTGLDGVSPHCVAKNTPHSDGQPYRDALDAGSNVCTFGSVVSVKHAAGSRITLTWDTHRCWKSRPKGVLLLIAMPHHMPLFDCTTVRAIPAGGHRNLRGYCTPVQSLGNTWVFVAPQQSIPWLGKPDPEKVPEILRTLKNDGNSSDMNFDFPYDAAHGIIDPYNAGKLLAKIARLVLIAHQLGEEEIHQTLLARLIFHMGTWLDHHADNIMLYDASWGGIISCGCWYNWLEDKKHGECKNYTSSLNTCPTLTDPGFDFGNGYYNDHHFHYGYFIYSAAVIAKFNASWVTEYNEKVLVLVRDIANPSPNDPYFSPFRYFDWFVGHSWASGLDANPLGRNQESTSEAVNAWYGIYLYGEATKNKALQDIGEAMILSEIHSTNTYWHVPQKLKARIYPKEYDHTMIGILHELLVEFQTYFGKSGYFVHGIQLLPITPIVHLMFHPDWLASGLPKFKQFCEGDYFCTESGFVAFYYAELALVDKKAAWDLTLKLSDKVFGVDCAGGNGNSRTNTLYFIASWGNHPEPNWTDLNQVVCQGPPVLSADTAAAAAYDASVPNPNAAQPTTTTLADSSNTPPQPGAPTNIAGAGAGGDDKSNGLSIWGVGAGLLCLIAFVGAMAGARHVVALRRDEEERAGLMSQA